MIYWSTSSFIVHRFGPSNDVLSQHSSKGYQQADLHLCISAWCFYLSSAENTWNTYKIAINSYVRLCKCREILFLASEVNKQAELTDNLGQKHLPTKMIKLHMTGKQLV